MNNFDLYIYHHLGLGDHISCHGIVRYYCGIHKRVFLFVKEHNYKNVKYMFNDLVNLEFIIGDDDFSKNYIQNNNIQNVLYVGFNLNATDNLEFQFYNMANLPVNTKYEYFHINRNIDREIEIFNELGLKKKDYIFLHSGDYKLNNGIIPSDIKIVEPTNHGLFDWMYVIENSKEIHCIDSSFICLIDCMKLNDDIKLVNHRYVRNYPEWIKLWTNKKWIEIK
jgi:hypothetical protein